MRLFFVLCIGILFSQTVAEVNGSPVTVEDLKSITKMNLENDIFHRQMLKENLDRAIDRELIYIDANERGYSIEENEEIQQQLIAFKKKLVIDMFIEKEIKPSIPVTDEEVEREYKFSSNFYKPKRYLTAFVQKINEDSDLSKAHEILSAIDTDKVAENQNEIYDQVFKKFEETGKHFHVDIMEFREDDYMLKEVPEIAESPKGKVTGPVGPDEKQMVFMVIDILPDESVPLIEVREEIEDRIRTRKLQEAVKAYVEEAKSKSKITIDNSVLSD